MADEALEELVGRKPSRAYRDRVLAIIDARIAACREALGREEPTSRGAATERSAMFEAQLIRERIAKLPYRSPLFSSARETEGGA